MTTCNQQANPSCEFHDSRRVAGRRASQMIGFASTLTILFVQTLIYSGAGDFETATRLLRNLLN